MIVENFGSNNYSDYKKEVDRGGKFVVYRYAISMMVYSFESTSKIYLVKGGHSGLTRALGYSLITFIAGWWGFPWGPVFTIRSIYTNLKGGDDVTDEVMEYKNQQLNPRNQYF